MNAPGTSPGAVGQQLARQREAMDLTQEDLGQRVGIAARTVSAIERGLNSISRSKRPAWEQALGLKLGTISRAYRDGAPIEQVEAEPASAVTADLPDDPDERLAELVRRQVELSAEISAAVGERKAHRRGTG